MKNYILFLGLWMGLLIIDLTASAQAVNQNAAKANTNKQGKQAQAPPGAANAARREKGKTSAPATINNNVAVKKEQPAK